MRDVRLWEVSLSQKQIEQLIPSTMDFTKMLLWIWTAYRDINGTEYCRAMHKQTEHWYRVERRGTPDILPGDNSNA